MVQYDKTRMIKKTSNLNINTPHAHSHDSHRHQGHHHGGNSGAEIGAFVAGVALASNPISFYIAESLKPLRDFFLADKPRNVCVSYCGLLNKGSGSILWSS
jgi:hypothetical protein